MIRRDSIEFAAAMAVGAAVGMGITLLVTPDAPAGPGREFRQRAGRALKLLRPGSPPPARRQRVGAALGGGQIRGAGQELSRILREEAGTFIRDSGAELVRALVRRQGKERSEGNGRRA